VGPQPTFEELYRRYAGRVRAYALRRIDASLADDVVADVFLIAWRRLDELPPEPLPCLLGTARRVLANRRCGEQRAFALRDRLLSERRSSPPGPAAAGSGRGPTCHFRNEAGVLRPFPRIWPN
jgi:DNA-directed RNA polymerase specialized sigma24 family protein